MATLKASPKKSKAVPKYTGEIYEVGTPVEMLRPSMWYGVRGVVASVDLKTGVHRVRLRAINGAPFHTEAPYHLMRFDF